MFSTIERLFLLVIDAFVTLAGMMTVLTYCALLAISPAKHVQDPFYLSVLPVTNLLNLEV